MIKKIMHISLFIILIVLLPFLLFITESESGNPANNVTGKDDLENIKLNEPLELSALYSSCEKDISLSPGEKDKPHRKPEPKPVPAQSSQVATRSASTPENSGSSSLLSQKEQQMVNLINEARRNAGLPALQVCSQLTAAARAKSKDMVDNNYFGHGSPTYGNFPGILKRFGIGYRAAAENLAMNSNGSVTAAHNSLMGSPGHRANILGSSFGRVGVGIYVRNDGSYYYTQLFTGR